MAGLSMYPSPWDQGSMSPSLDSLSTRFTNSANTFNNTSLTGSGGSGSFLDSILEGTGDMSGLQMGQLGLGGVNSLLQGYLGFQDLGLAKKQYQSQLDQP